MKEQLATGHMGNGTMETKEVHDRNEHMQTAVAALNRLLAMKMMPPVSALTDAIRQIASVSADEVEHRAKDYFAMRADLDDALLDRLHDNDVRWETQVAIDKRMMSRMEDTMAVLERLLTVVEKTQAVLGQHQRLEIASRILAAWETGFFNQQTFPEKRAKRALICADALIAAASQSAGEKEKANT